MPAFISHPLVLKPHRTEYAVVANNLVRQVPMHRAKCQVP